MDFNKLNYLMAVAELKSFSKAAEKCFVSQPALTRCVKSIEEELGIKLFDRSCSPIKLTYAGERYIAGMQEILDMKIRLDQEMAELAARKRDKLMLGIPSTRSATWLPRVLPAFQKVCPNVDIQLVEGSSYSLEQLLSKGTIDLYLMGTEPILTKGVTMDPLYKEEMILVVSRQAEILKGIELPPNRPGVLQYLPASLLEHMPFYSATPSQGTYYIARRLFDRHNIQPVAIMEIINTTAAYQMAPGSGGFALAPTTVTYEEQFTPEPLFCSLTDKVFYRMAGIFYRENDDLSDAARIFKDVATREIRQFAKERIPSFTVAHDIDFPQIGGVLR